MINIIKDDEIIEGEVIDMEPEKKPSFWKKHSKKIIGGVLGVLAVTGYFCLKNKSKETEETAEFKENPLQYDTRIFELKAIDKETGDTFNLGESESDFFCDFMDDTEYKRLVDTVK